MVPAFGRTHEEKDNARDSLDPKIADKENDESGSKLHNRYKRNQSQNQSMSNY